ncbi:MAG: hypothetical protein PUB11_07220, partial [Oscillospiraceae bacterium]|nr:hypothetical protein [Oscillospiraceae bacterium]
KNSDKVTLSSVAGSNINVTVKDNVIGHITVKVKATVKVADQEFDDATSTREISFDSIQFKDPAWLDTKQWILWYSYYTNTSQEQSKEIQYGKNNKNVLEIKYRYRDDPDIDTIHYYVISRVYKNDKKDGNFTTQYWAKYNNTWYKYVDSVWKEQGSGPSYDGVRLF